MGQMRIWGAGMIVLAMGMPTWGMAAQPGAVPVDGGLPIIKNDHDAGGAPVGCTSGSGSCEVMQDFVTCNCANGASTGEARSQGGLPSPPPTLEECKSRLAKACSSATDGGAGDSGGVSCESKDGRCSFSGGSYNCSCANGMGAGGGGSPGGPNPPPPTREECEKTLASICSSTPGGGGEIKCENPAGRCNLWNTGSDCRCVDGRGVSSSSGSDPSQPPPNAPPPTSEQCDALLVKTCGSEAPDINKICQPASVAWCDNNFGSRKECFRLEWSLNHRIECCKEYDRQPEAMGKLLECAKKIDCSDPSQAEKQLEACADSTIGEGPDQPLPGKGENGGGTSGGSTPPRGDAGADSADSGSAGDGGASQTVKASGTGCTCSTPSSGARAPWWAAVSVIAGAVLLFRRRRK
ncbi:MAG: hypothetical protein GMKNLPBB_01968 [Myxococcota bacterium]|nr:hypothetical protein [Myxococcota bacterium]